MDQISLIISVISLLISLVALFIAVWHNIKSFTPILTILKNISSINGEISIVIENKGIGPATLTRLEFLFDGKSIGDNFDEVLKILESKNLYCEYYFQNRGSGSVLSSGDKFIPIRLVFPNNQLPKETVELFNHISTRVFYKSIYGIKYRQRIEQKSG